jgi:hypothetical protein
MNSRWHDNPWLRRSTFLAANAGVALAIVLLAVQPVRDLLAARGLEIAEQRATLSRFRALAAQEAAVDAASKQAPADSGEYLAGPNEGVINADLQTRLKGLVEPAGARVRAVRILAPVSADGIRYLGSRIEIFGTLAALHRAIAAIEAGKPFLFVRGAVIKPAAASGVPNPAQEPLFDAQLDVFGAVRLDGGKP